MQFYRVNSNPSISAQMLPDYALAKVNVREGYQILCDIGHANNIVWKHQFKPYSPYHAKTRLFWQDKEAFTDFINHYQANLNEYKIRMEAGTKFFTKLSYIKYSNLFSNFIDNKYKDLKKVLPITRSDYEFDRFYLLERKSDKLTDTEIQRLREWK